MLNKYPNFKKNLAELLQALGLTLLAFILLSMLGGPEGMRKWRGDLEDCRRTGHSIISCLKSSLDGASTGSGEVRATSTEERYKKFLTLQQLIAARSLKCIFTSGSAGVWENGKFTFKTFKDDLSLNFDAIDHKARKARLIGNIGADDVIVLASPAGITFLEETLVGNRTITTIYGEPDRNGEFIAVTSRHVTVADYPFPNQLHGTCKVLQ